MYISVHNIHLSWIYFQPHLALAFFFFNHPATTEIYTLSLHDALPISLATRHLERPGGLRCTGPPARPDVPGQLRPVRRSGARGGRGRGATGIGLPPRQPS